jgi:hypothetical protein
VRRGDGVLKDRRNDDEKDERKMTRKTTDWGRSECQSAGEWTRRLACRDLSGKARGVRRSPLREYPN